MSSLLSLRASHCAGSAVCLSRLSLLLAIFSFSLGVAAQEQPTGREPAQVERPYLGAMLCDLTDEEAAAFPLQAPAGAVVWKLTPESPAELAGLQAGDVIRMVNAQEIRTAADFLMAFSQLNSGDRLDLSVQRDRELRNVSLVLAPPKKALPPPNQNPPPTESLPPTEPPTTGAKPPPDGLEFSSAARPLSYEQPERHFRLQLPADWAVHAGHRGRTADERFDTLLDRSGNFQVIIWRQPLPAKQGQDQLMQLADLLGAEGLQYRAVGFGEVVDRTNWSHLSIQFPESASQIIYAGAIQDERLWRFDFVAFSEQVESGLPEPLRLVRDAVRFSGAPGRPTEDLPKPTAQDLPKDLQRLKNVFDGQPRSLDLELVSGGTPEAIELEIESPAGAAVASVRPRTTAAAAGLRRGDLIVQLGDQEINTPEDVEAVVWTTPVDQLIPLTYVRREQRVTTMLKIAVGEARRPVLGEYRHTTGGYVFRYFPNWRLHPDARREEVTERVYDYLSSRSLNFKLLLFHDRSAAPDPVASLQEFLEETSKGFLEGYSGWVAAGEIPIVFTSGVVGREQLQTLYRIAFVVDGQRYEVNAFTSVLYDPAQLPRVLQTILGSLEQPR